MYSRTKIDSYKLEKPGTLHSLKSVYGNSLLDGVLGSSGFDGRSYFLYYFLMHPNAYPSGCMSAQ